MTAPISPVDELERRFASLAPQIPEGPHKEALSTLHGLILEVRRERQAAGMRDDAGLTVQDIADLWRGAPAMEGDAVSTPLPVGQDAPDFELPDASGHLVRLSDFRGRPVVLVFYPLDWSPGCSRQLDLYEQELDEFTRRGAQLLAVSVDSVYSHGAWAAVRGLSFPLLADFHPKGEVARRYGVWRPEDGLSDRALYVIDNEGRIAHAHVSPKIHHIPDIYELFEALDRLPVTEPVAA